MTYLRRRPSFEWQGTPLRVIRIGDKEVGNDRPVMIVAEAGVNHNGKVDLAKKLVDAAKDAGADAVKFQTFAAEKVISRSAPKASYQLDLNNRTETQLEMVKKLQLPQEAFSEIATYAEQENIIFFSTPFDEDSADLLERLSVPVFKISSGDLNHLPFLTYVASKGRPMIVSTGMSTLEDVRSAVETIKLCGNENIILTHCVSSYPAPIKDANLRAINTLQSVFDVPIGYSDHTLGFEVAMCAVALGACLIEKHLTLDKSLPGPDHKASLDPPEFARMAKAIRLVEQALGSYTKAPTESELDVMRVARRSIVASRDIAEGEIITREKIDFKRPATGLPPFSLSAVLGRRAKRDIGADNAIKADDLA